MLLNDVAEYIRLSVWCHVDAHDVLPTKCLLLGGEFVEKDLDIGTRSENVVGSASVALEKILAPAAEL